MVRCNVPGCRFGCYSRNLAQHKKTYHSKYNTLAYQTTPPTRVRVVRRPDGKMPCPCGKEEHTRFSYTRLLQMSRKDKHPGLDSELYDDFAPGAIPVQNRVRVVRTRPKGVVKRSATRMGTQSTSDGAIAPLSETEKLKNRVKLLQQEADVLGAEKAQRIEEVEKKVLNARIAILEVKIKATQAQNDVLDGLLGI